MLRRKEVVIEMYENGLTEELVNMILIQAFKIELACLCDGFYVTHPDSRSFVATKFCYGDYLKLIVDYEHVDIFLNAKPVKKFNIREFELKKNN